MSQPAHKKRKSSHKKPTPAHIDWSIYKDTDTFPWSIDYVARSDKNATPSHSKGHVDLEGFPPQHNPWAGKKPDTQVTYSVRPSDWWETTASYRKFTIQQETFAVNDIVIVKGEDTGVGDDNNGSPDRRLKSDDWVAKVLEVRAADEQHVFLRVYWLYRPEDLPNGRQPYHGRNELIATNHMELIDATTVQRKEEVEYRVEQDDKAEKFDPLALYWRQQFHFNPTKPKKSFLSELPKHCIDDAPANFDNILIQCTHCEKWLHGPCIEQDAVRKLQPPEANLGRSRTSTDQMVSTPKSTPTSAKKKKKSNSTTPADNVFSAELVIVNGQAPRLRMTDLRPVPGEQGHEFDLPVNCLFCQEEIEQGEDGDEEEARADNTALDQPPAIEVSKEDTPKSEEVDPKRSLKSATKEVDGTDTPATQRKRKLITGGEVQSTTPSKRPKSSTIEDNHETPAMNGTSNNGANGSSTNARKSSTLAGSESSGTEGRAS